MFKPEKIYRTIALLPKERSQKTISSLYERSICQVKESVNDLDPNELPEDEQKILSLYSRLSFVIESLEQYSNKLPPNMIKELFSKKRIIKPKRDSFSKKELFGKTEECLDIIEETVKNNIKRIKELEEKRNENEYIISNLKYLPNIETSLLKDTENIKKIIGIINNSSLEKIEQKIKNKSVILAHPIDKRTSLLIVVCKEKEGIEKTLHETGFDSIKIPFEDKFPKEIIKNIRKENLLLTNKESRLCKEQHKLYLTYDSLLKYTPTTTTQPKTLFEHAYGSKPPRTI